MSNPAPKKAIPPTDEECEPFEKVLIPQKLYFKKGSLHTVAHEISTKRCAVFACDRDLEVMKLVEKELEVIQGLERVYPIFIDEDNHKLAVDQINSVLPLIDTVIAVGSYKLFNEIACRVAENPRQLIVIPTDGKPLSLVCGIYVDENNQVHTAEDLIPEFVILDSGLTHNITVEDTKMCQQVCAVEEETQMITWTHEAQKISAELIAEAETMDHPVWCERATNLVGITMLGKPSGERVLKVLGLI